ncbi:uncharacterized protein PFLUO_LOCUS5344 [Penicillium psychrofluorescens]|uniref:uncharacterized protein n=1 Tax=Penicillium psychrofluorescens TaxID=3158075 RepID=UPI003CCD239D
MPAPIAKGIIVTVSVLVAAGIAVYESPQFQQWVINSRRKIALALHHLGDEIQPPESASPFREDISMTEETGEAAEERRRIARADIMHRGTLLEARRRARDSQHPLESFDTLVDEDGKLVLDGASDSGTDHAANSTAVELGAQQPLWRGGKHNEAPENLPDRDRLQVEIPGDTASNHPSESLLQYTPTSETLGESTPFGSFSNSPMRPQSPGSASASSHTEDHFYAHPDSVANPAHQHGLLLADLDGLGHEPSQLQHDVSAAPSTAGSFSHVGNLTDRSSEGTLSDLGDQSVGEAATPASWSEVGSVISNDDAGHHQLL